MSFWKQIKQRLVKEKLHSGPCVKPISQGLIQRSEQEMLAYQTWEASPSKKKMLSYISQNYKIWKKTPCEQCDGIDFLKMKSFNGFIVHFMDLESDADDVQHLFDYLKEKVRSLGYQVYVSDVKEFKRTRWIERAERHYLKPSIKHNLDEKREQRFGNINIELLYRDGEPLHLKFAACTYQDSQFNDAQNFEELVHAITA